MSREVPLILRHQDFQKVLFVQYFQYHLVLPEDPEDPVRPVNLAYQTVQCHQFGLLHQSDPEVQPPLEVLELLAVQTLQ